LSRALSEGAKGGLFPVQSRGEPPLPLFASWGPSRPMAGFCQRWTGLCTHTHTLSDTHSHTDCGHAHLLRHTHTCISCGHLLTHKRIHRQAHTHTCTGCGHVRIHTGTCSDTHTPTQTPLAQAVTLTHKMYTPMCP